jgi:predicted HTH transcriptional regulator
MDEDPFEADLRTILKLRPGVADILRNRESPQLEFKEAFHPPNRSKYAKTMASFANNRGGYIVFGVAPSPHKIKGLNAEKWEGWDPVQLTEFLNSSFSPQIEWRMGIIDDFPHPLGLSIR